MLVYVECTNLQFSFKSIEQSTEISKDQYLNTGMDSFLSKPFKPEHLQALLIEGSESLSVLR